MVDICGLLYAIELSCNVNIGKKLKFVAPDLFNPVDDKPYLVKVEALTQGYYRQRLTHLPFDSFGSFSFFAVDLIIFLLRLSVSEAHVEKEQDALTKRKHHGRLLHESRDAHLLLRQEFLSTALAFRFRLEHEEVYLATKILKCHSLKVEFLLPVKLAEVTL